MSESLRRLRWAVRQFVNRPLEEEIDSWDLQRLIEDLEDELGLVNEPPEERARIRAKQEADMQRPEMQAALRQISERYGAKPS
jgi:hypothetical protein